MPGAVKVNLTTFSVESVKASAETLWKTGSTCSFSATLLLVCTCSGVRPLAPASDRLFTN
jgi:hypothetical protein